MRYRWEVISTIASRRVIAIVRERTEAEGARLAGALLDAGLEVIEVTMSTPGVLRTVESLRDSDALVGVGTVLSPADVASAAGAGARFIVTPHLSPDVIRAANRYGLASVVGCSTPTEMVRALEEGADAVKLFPASAFDPSHLSAVHAPLPWAPIIPTGGVSVANAAAWIDAGAVAVAMGGGLARGSADEVRVTVAELKASLGVG